MVAVIDYEKLGNKIKSIRQSKNLTQDYIANAIGCNVSHVSNIENNHTKVSLNVLFSIADVLGVTMDYLLSDQLSDKNEVLELEIMKCVKEMPIDQKEQVLRIIRVLQKITNYYYVYVINMRVEKKFLNVLFVVYSGIIYYN